MVCGLGSLRFPVITESNGHHSSQEDKEDFNYWLKLSQSRYTVLGTKHNLTFALLLCRYMYVLVSQLKLIALQDGERAIVKAHNTFSTVSAKHEAIKLIFGKTQVRLPN